MKRKLVSVIIPVYNSEKYIKKCLDSVLNQSFKDIEIIVIDDGSTDNSREIINRYSDDRIVKEFISNGGVSNARNLGIKKAKGKYIMFLDSDDYIENDTVESLYNYARKTNVDFIRFNGYIESERGHFSKLEFPIKNGEIIDSNDSTDRIIDIFNNVNNSMRCYTPLLFIKNKEIKMFDKNLKYLEDKVFYLENILSNKRVLFLNETFYYYTYNSNSKTKNIDKFCESFYDMINSRENLIKITSKYDYPSIKIDESYCTLILSRIDYLARNTSYSIFRNDLKKIINDNDIFKHIFMQSYLNLSKLKKIEYQLLRKKRIFELYVFFKIKNIVRTLIGRG